MTSGVALWLWNGAASGLARLVLPAYKVKSTYTSHGFDLQVSVPRWPDDFGFPRVEIKSANRTMFATEMPYPTLGSATIEVAPQDGQQTQVLWIRSDSGGSLGDSITYVFDAWEPEEGTSEIGTLLPAAVLHNGIFEVDGNLGSSDPTQIHRWKQFDLSYRYWLTTGVNSPTPVLFAHLRRGSSEQLQWIAPTPSDAPSAATLASARERVRALAQPDPNAAPIATARDQALGAVLKPFLDLVYAGQSDAAWRFLHASLDDGLGTLLASAEGSDLPRSREALETVLMQAINASPFIGEILRRNGGSIAPGTSP